MYIALKFKNLTLYPKLFNNEIIIKERERERELKEIIKKNGVSVVGNKLFKEKVGKLEKG